MIKILNISFSPLKIFLVINYLYDEYDGMKSLNHNLMEKN